MNQAKPINLARLRLSNESAYVCKMLLWLKNQPEEEAHISKTPFPEKHWRILITRKIVERIKKGGVFSWIKLKPSKDTREVTPLPAIEFPSGRLSKAIPAGTEHIFCSISENYDPCMDLSPREYKRFMQTTRIRMSDAKPPLISPRQFISGSDLWLDFLDSGEKLKKVCSENPGFNDNYPKVKPVTTNQGRGAEIKWKHLAFRSDHEVAIAQALDNLPGRGVMFFPNAAVRLTAEGKRVTKEVDFLICRDGHWGILEVDGVQHRESRAEDQVRDDAFTDYGVWFIRRYTAKDCMSNALHVVADFLRRLDAFYAHLSK